MTDPITRVITRDQAEEWDLHYDAPGQLATERLDKHRWYTVMRVIFTAPDDGQVWAAEYNEPLSEVQEGQDPWDDAKKVTLTRYESYEKSVTAWRPAGTGDDVPPPAGRDALEQLAAVTAERDKAYRERAQLVAYLSAVYPAEIVLADDAPGWWLVFVSTPSGQMSWHIADSDLSLFGHLPPATGVSWDGHTTDEKYQRLAELVRTVATGIYGPQPGGAQ